jgi:hypothetical protein
VQVNRVESLVGKPAEDDAWLVQNAEGENFPEIKIRSHDDAMVRRCTLRDFAVGSPFESQRPNMDRIVTEAIEEFDGLRRYAGIREESHESGRQRVNFFLGKSRRIGERLANVLFLELRQLLDNLCRRQAVCEEG